MPLMNNVSILIRQDIQQIGLAHAPDHSILHQSILLYKVSSYDCYLFMDR